MASEQLWNLAQSHRNANDLAYVFVPDVCCSFGACCPIKVVCADSYNMSIEISSMFLVFINNAALVFIDRSIEI